jgi:hypothetical protein
MMQFTRLLGRRRGGDDPAEHAIFVELAYRAVLGRAPDPGGAAAYAGRLARGEIDAAGVLAELLASDEYRAGESFDPAAHSPELAGYRAGRDAALEAALEDCSALTLKRYEAAWEAHFAAGRELVIGQGDYAPQHRRRFFELFNAVALLLADRPAGRLLEFGVSEYSGLYRVLLPELALELADRPVPEDYPGFTAQRSLAVSGAAAFHAVDLNDPAQLAAAGELAGRFDVVVFAEVLEHLLADPVAVLRYLLSLLAAEGSLYLTTPNFLRRDNLELIAARDNPQPTYPPGDDNWDLHHHHREYTARELLRFIEAAGGHCRAFYYSDCWDDPGRPARCAAERASLVFVVSRAG